MEFAVIDICAKRAIFKPMTADEHEALKKMWGLLETGPVILIGWRSLLQKRKIRRNSRTAEGPGHGNVVTLKGTVYSFGSSRSGQLGHGTTEVEWSP